MTYLLHILVLINTIAVLALALNLVAGFAGLLSTCHAAFFAFGAYSTAILMVRANCEWIVTVVAGVLFTVIAGLLIGRFLLKFRDDWFVLGTFVFQIIIFGLLENGTDITGGPLGISGIPRPRVFGWKLSSELDFAVLSSILLIAVLMLTRRIASSSFGRELMAIRENPDFPRALGKDVARLKSAAFALSAALAAVAGSVYAAYVGYIGPDSFSIQQSIFLLSVVIIGGAGTVYGPVLGAALLIALPESLRWAGFSAGSAGYIRQIIYGALLIACIVWRPRGLLGRDRHSPRSL